VPATYEPHDGSKVSAMQSPLMLMAASSSCGCEHDRYAEEDRTVEARAEMVENTVEM
jgi:hypothetical protein